MTPLEIEFDREEDGRWIAECPCKPSRVLTGEQTKEQQIRAASYGSTREEAAHNVEALALPILADRIESSEEAPAVSSAFVMTA